MAGSIRWWKYRASATKTYAIQADESNIRLIHPAADLDLTGIGLLEQAPKTLRLRTVTLKDSTNLRTRKIPVLTQDTFDDLDGNTDYVTDSTTQGADPNPGATFNVAWKTPQKQKLIPKLQDTGLNDGTAQP